MLHWALISLIVALGGGLLGFGGIASAGAGFATVLLVVFLILLVSSLVAHLMLSA